MAFVSGLRSVLRELSKFSPHLPCRPLLTGGKITRPNACRVVVSVVGSAVALIVVYVKLALLE